MPQLGNNLLSFSSIKNTMSGNTSGPISQGLFSDFNPFITGTYGNIISISTLKNQYSFPPPNSNASSMIICFSCRLIIPSYTGPIFKLRRSSDNVVQDFYTDEMQTFLTTGANNTGTSYSTWIGSSTAYIVTWYDQSGNGNHATNNTNNTTQPNISFQNNKYIIQFQKNNSTVLNVPNIRPNTIFCHFYNTNSVYGGSIMSTPYDYQMRFGGGAVNINGDSNGGDWYYMGSLNGGTCLSYNNGVSSSTVAVNEWNLFTVSLSTPQWSTNQTGNVATYFTRIGQDGYSAVNRSIDGYMTEMICHNKALTTDDILSYYNNKFF